MLTSHTRRLCFVSVCNGYRNPVYPGLIGALHFLFSVNRAAEQNRDATFGEKERSEYAAFKEARTKLADNTHDAGLNTRSGYMPLSGKFAQYLDDPYTVMEERAPVSDHVEVRTLLFVTRALSFIYRVLCS